MNESVDVSRITHHVSVIATVKNEAQTVHRLLDSLAAQTRPPDEVVIVDGGSTDGTVEVLEGYASGGALPLKVLVRPGTNISQGRNAAIAETTGEIIASTDAGVRLSPNWLEELVKPFEKNRELYVVSGFFAPDPQSVFETALGATVLPVLADVKPDKFLPSSRSVAFRKEAWKRVGGYPEWLDYCEDLVFDFKLRELGPFAFAPRALAYFRPRKSLGDFFQQYYRYARGDGKADLWRVRHAIRYATYLIALPAIFLLGLWRTPLWWLLFLAGGAIMFWTPYKRLWPMIKNYSLADKIKAILWAPIIRVMGDMAKMVGYPVGVLWRLRYRCG
ncbi:MAG: glycosyltransferase [Anaerolineales bacterium]|nr:glycosyltransferase [Anaerolineales bacterium]